MQSSSLKEGMFESTGRYMSGDCDNIVSFRCDEVQAIPDDAYLRISEDIYSYEEPNLWDAARRHVNLV